jgi:blue copper oxidase
MEHNTMRCMARSTVLRGDGSQACRRRSFPRLCSLDDPNHCLRMRRRDLLRLAGASATLPAGGCALGSRDGVAGARVPLSSVRELRVEHVDPLLGRCRYVAVTGAAAVAQPLLVARPGDVFDATIVNRLPQQTTVHFHGLVLPQAQDGAGFDPIPPGGRRRARFQVHNRGGLYWFHPHPHGLTAEQVSAGLFGLLCVVDEDDAALDASLALAPPNRIAAGVRLQLLNACNARGLLLAFELDGAALPFALLGTDGGLLAAPVEVERLFLHPAERVDVALRVPAGRTVAALSAPFDAREHLELARLPARHKMRHDAPPLAQASVCIDADRAADRADMWPRDGSPLPLFRLRVQAEALGHIGELPARLSSLAPVAVAPETAAVRRWRLDLDPQLGFLINGAPYRRDEEPFSIVRGAHEVWEIKNSPISMAHPMHLHGPGFRVLRRQGTFGPARALASQGQGRLATDLGLKDTVTVWPNETVWLSAWFGLPTAPEFAGRQRYMFHCHNLEHEDGMMMRNFVLA